MSGAALLLFQFRLFGASLVWSLPRQQLVLNHLHHLALIVSQYYIGANHSPEQIPFRICLWLFLPSPSIMTKATPLPSAQGLVDHGETINTLLRDIRSSLMDAKTQGLDALSRSETLLSQLEGALTSHHDGTRGSPLKVHVFHVGSLDGVLAAGVGQNVAEAAADAVERIKLRAVAVGGNFSADRLEGPYREVYAALLAGTAKSVYTKDVRNASDLVTNWPDGYFSLETSVVASTVQSSKELLDRIRQAIPLTGRDKLVHAPTFTVMGAVREFGIRKLLDAELDVNMIDWREVAMDLDRETLGLDAAEVQASRSAVAPVGASPSAPALAKLRQVKPHVLEVLKECTVNDAGVLQLPPRQLEAKLYQDVKKTLGEVEAKWSKKDDGFVFKLNNAREALRALAGQGEYLAVKDLGFFPTPDHLVDQMIAAAQLEPGMLVLEPSAGRGAIALKAAEIVGLDNVLVCELYPENAKILREQGFDSVLEADFLKIDPEPIYDVVLMNPPFTRGADMAHVLHATQFLKPEGRLVAIMSPGWETNSGKNAELFRGFVADVEAEVVPIASGEFKAAGTDIATRLVVMDAANFPANRDAQIPSPASSASA